MDFKLGEKMFFLLFYYHKTFHYSKARAVAGSAKCLIFINCLKNIMKALNYLENYMPFTTALCSQSFTFFYQFCGMELSRTKALGQNREEVENSFSVFIVLYIPIYTYDHEYFS